MIRYPTSRWTELADRLGTPWRARAAAHDDADTFVADNYADLKSGKALSAGVPEELGGGGASVADLAGMLRTMAHHCSSTALALSMHTHLVATAAWRWRNLKAPVDGLLNAWRPRSSCSCRPAGRTACRTSRRRCSRVAPPSGCRSTSDGCGPADT
jgi:hypothetical protein